MDVRNDHTATFSDALVKRCTKCGATKPHSEFSKDRTRRDGLRPHCKQCAAKYHARYRSANADKLSESKARYRSDNADKINAGAARYRSENADKINADTARYRSENPAKERANQARWRQANPDKVRAAGHRRRATMRALPSQWTDTDIQRMLAYWDNRCAVCGQHVEPNNAFYYLAQDHWIPLTSPECPGTVAWNMLPLCHSKIGNTAGCNSAKSNADPIEWLNRLYPNDPKLVAKILARIAKYFKAVTDGAL